MKERLIQLLDLEQLSPSKFADIIGVQRSSISHVISGRNKPSFDFLQKTLKAFPGLNASWLMLGEGTMYEQMGRNVSGNLFDSPRTSQESAEGPLSEQEELHVDAAEPEEGITPEREELNHAESAAAAEESQRSMPGDALQAALAASANKQIVQVMLIYEDDTFRVFMPSN